MPFLSPGQAHRQVTLGRNRVDATIPVSVEGQIYTLILAVKSSGEPRQVRAMIHFLGECLPLVEQGYGIIAAPYLSEDSVRLCRESGLGHLDLSGNCFLNFDRVFIERRLFPNASKEKRRLRSLYSPRASRVLRVLLTEPGRSWMIKDLAGQARVSLGMAFKVKERLLDLEYAAGEGKKVRLARPLALLTEWGRHYPSGISRAVDYFGYGNYSDLEKQVLELCRERGIPHALTLFSGAGRLVPAIRFNRGFVYVGKELDSVAERLAFKPVPAGANITLLEPYDEGVWYGVRDVGGTAVVSDAQLYLDLTGFPEGQDAARTFLETRIRPGWKPDAGGGGP